MAKFATICYVANDLVGDKDLVQHGLGQLKAAFGAFAANQQKFPLMYESMWSQMKQTYIAILKSDRCMVWCGIVCYIRNRQCRGRLR